MKYSLLQALGVSFAVAGVLAGLIGLAMGGSPILCGAVLVWNGNIVAIAIWHRNSNRIAAQDADWENDSGGNQPL